ncbi:MAG: CRISPR-associated endonuclease Cas2 [Firmicutes bacterium]|nr:CRISPR-associated endonuclease Cas2 [Bacillota bacterium]
MFVILVYDAASKRDPKLLKLCRQYLTWVQNSVFEGELTEVAYRMLKYEIKALIEREEDSIIIYKFRTTKYMEREVIGVEKGLTGNIF